MPPKYRILKDIINLGNHEKLRVWISPKESGISDNIGMLRTFGGYLFPRESTWIASWRVNGNLIGKGQEHYL